MALWVLPRREMLSRNLFVFAELIVQSVPQLSSNVEFPYIITVLVPAEKLPRKGSPPLVVKILRVAIIHLTQHRKTKVTISSAYF